MTQEGNTVTLYVNGVAETSEDSFPVVPNGSVFIGSEGSSSGSDGNRNFEGLIDELRIYSHAISEEQITAFYNNGIPNHEIVVHSETQIGDFWMVAVTPNDGLLDGSPQYPVNLHFIVQQMIMIATEF